MSPHPPSSDPAQSGLLHPLRPRRNDRRLARHWSFALRQMTAGLRAQPDFLVAGAMKSGTSSLFYYLSQHPRIASPLRKETHYFTAGHRAGKRERWYRAHFPLRWQVGRNRLTGEATPGYMFETGIPQRIAEALPEVRIIVVLRDPAARAISHYHHEVALGREYLPIREAIAIEDERLNRAAAAGAAGLETYLHASYKARGVYVDQIRRLEAAFPRSRILVLGSGTLFRRPAEALGTALEFLGLPFEGDYDFARKNSGKSGDPVPDGVRAELDAYFEPYNADLSDHLAYRPDW